jgi:hypothetical protein
MMRKKPKTQGADFMVAAPSEPNAGRINKLVDSKQKEDNRRGQKPQN